LLNQSALFLATAVWAGVFGIWSGLCAGASFLCERAKRSLSKSTPARGERCCLGASANAINAKSCSTDDPDGSLKVERVGRIFPGRERSKASRATQPLSRSAKLQALFPERSGCGSESRMTAVSCRSKLPLSDQSLARGAVGARRAAVRARMDLRVAVVPRRLEALSAVSLAGRRPLFLVEFGPEKEGSDLRSSCHFPHITQQTAKCH